MNDLLKSQPAPTARVTEPLGLSQAEAARRLAEHGRNEIQREKTRSP